MFSLILLLLFASITWAQNSTNVTTAAVLGSASTKSTILILARDAPSAAEASSGLNGYGIPFQSVLVPQSGVALPTLGNNATGQGNYGGIVVVGQVSYDYGGTTGFQSALTTDQWNTLYAYQINFGVRMVQLDVYPGPAFGANALGGCCGGEEQLISFSSSFTATLPQAGLKSGAGVSTQGLWHYPASIVDGNTTEVAQFAANSQFSSPSTAAVVSNFAGRQQMAFFIGWATDWSATSNYLQHAWITWITRGLYAGYRRVLLNTQIDDLFLITDIYSPNGTTFRIRPEDLSAHVSWTPTINSKMNAGSQYFVELGHNGNGNIEAAAGTSDAAERTCNPGSIEYDSPPDTPLEFQKPLGTGTDLWPPTPKSYTYTTACLNLDPLKVWMATPANRDAFAHITHTFTHEECNNATYADVYKEITFNQAWFTQSGVGSAQRFTANGLIPPAITGLHNGDALRAWHDAGLRHAVGDNTRPVLLNPTNKMWPLITTVAANGFDGFEIIPRWATRIYYNCDLPDCTVAEWVGTSSPAPANPSYTSLLATELQDSMRHTFQLDHAGYMFHQANLRNADVPSTTINGVSYKYSMLQTWVQQYVDEFTRVVNWPLISLTQADTATSFSDRMARDACGYSLTWTSSNSQITGLTVTANGNTCSTPIPVTFPSPPTSTSGFKTEKVGNDPLTVWVTLSGSPVTFTLSQPIKW